MNPSPAQPSANELLSRRGKFAVSKHLLEEWPQAVMKVLSECIVVRCEMDWLSEEFKYSAISPHFEKVEDYTEAPDYHALMERVDTGTEEQPSFEIRFKGFQKIITA